MKALFVAGQICSFMGRYDEAQLYLRESLSIARSADDSDFMVVVLNNIARASLGQGDRADARSRCEEAVTLARQTGNKQRIVTASNALAQLHRLDGDLDAAEVLYCQCETLARELGNADYVSVALLNLAMVAIARGTVQRAAALLREVLAISDKTGSKPAEQSAVEVSACLAGRREEWERAARYYGAVENETRRTGIVRDASDQAFLAPIIAQSRAVLGSTEFARCEAAGRALPFEGTVSDVRAWLSGI
jgi:ATP/maltotriose-dependent transcriptional regulator MalT